VLEFFGANHMSRATAEALQPITLGNQQQTIYSQQPEGKIPQFHLRAKNNAMSQKIEQNI
jgi:hypothetical protein